MPSRPISRAEVTRIIHDIRDVRLPARHAEIAREQLALVLAAAPVPYKQYVDGREGAPLNSVRLGGMILFRFTRVGQIIVWIYEHIYQMSPVRTGAYRTNHHLYADGALVGLGSPTVQAPPARIYQLVNIRDYARRIEHGWSIQAPDGVYEITAIAAKKMFPNADIVFSYTNMGTSTARNRRRSYAYPTITVRSPP